MPETDRGAELVDRTTLSEREADVAALKEDGLTHEEIAEELDLATGTIDSYAHRARQKFEIARETAIELNGIFS